MDVEPDQSPDQFHEEWLPMRTLKLYNGRMHTGIYKEISALKVNDFILFDKHSRQKRSVELTGLSFLAKALIDPFHTR